MIIIEKTEGSNDQTSNTYVTNSPAVKQRNTVDGEVAPQIGTISVSNHNHGLFC